MGFLSFAGALLVLLIGAVILNFASQSLEGRKTFFVHFGLILLIVLVGGVLFPFWGWTSTAWVLGTAALLSIVPPLWDRIRNDAPPSGYLWFGDEPTPDDDEGSDG